MPDNNNSTNTTTTYSAKEELFHNLAALVKVATLITIVVIVVFAVLALTGKLEPSYVTNVITMVVTFYFGSKALTKQ